jgi:large subunit ribosomal protein L6
MSRVGNKQIDLPSGVKVEVRNQSVKVTGPKGSLDWSFPSPIQVEVDGETNAVKLSRPDDEKRSRALHGLSRALIANMVEGVTNGYARALEVYGTGYGCKLEGKSLHLNCGFMGRGHNAPAQFIIPVPEGITVNVAVPTARGDNEPAKFTVSGIDKQLVGQFAADVRGIRPPEPYKGKGIRYADEQVRRKQGKKAFASG